MAAAPSQESNLARCNKQAVDGKRVSIQQPEPGGQLHRAPAPAAPGGKIPSHLLKKTRPLALPGCKEVHLFPRLRKVQGERASQPPINLLDILEERRARRMGGVPGVGKVPLADGRR